MTYTATYSPDDNKLRLYALSRLEPELYQRVKAHGFIWAPKQDCFVAPMWTPQREDLLTELAGEIEDEDTPLEERQRQRAERFEQYRENRTADAEQAHKRVDQIAERFAGGQPILIGHHSERGARRDAEKIENGMRRALNLWKTAEYWKQRAAGALAHARYKARPDVRARRIKTIEAAKRKDERTRAKAQKFLNTYNDPEAQTLRLKDGRDFLTALLSTFEGGLSYDGQRDLEQGKITREEALETAKRHKTAVIETCNRWIEHYDNRLTYEREMLRDAGAEHLLDKKPRPALLPLCNYRAPEGLDVASPYRREPMHLSQIEMTQEEYSRIATDYKGTRPVGNSHRVRTAMQRGGLHCVFLTDAKTHTPPGAIAPEPAKEPTHRETYHRPEPTEAERKIEQLQGALRAGVQVVTAPQLFPTPDHVAARMVELAELEPGMTVLEPSAGTGNILRAIRKASPETPVTAIEQNDRLAGMLSGIFPDVPVFARDFLTCNGDVGTFDRIIMNPPFKNAADIEHIAHAVNMLKPGGKVIAICAGGPRQEAQLRPVASTWEPLPPGTFSESGTDVNTVLLTIEGYSFDES